MKLRDIICGCGLSFVALQGCAAPQAGDNVEAQNEQLLRDSIGRELGSISRSIVELNREMDSQMNLVARVEVQPNEMLEIYEVAPGRLLLSGAGRPERLSDLENQDLTDLRLLWPAIAGDAAMPQALDEALVRQDARRANLPARVPSNDRPTSANKVSAPASAAIKIGPAESGIATRVAATGTGWCDTTWWTNKVSGYSPYAFGECPHEDFNVCWNNVTGTGWASTEDAGTLWTNVCPFFGSVTFAVGADESWIAQGQWNVPENTVRWKKTSDPGCDAFPWTNDCPSIRVDITNSLGDAYNFRFNKRD